MPGNKLALLFLPQIVLKEQSLEKEQSPCSGESSLGAEGGG